MSDSTVAESNRPAAAQTRVLSNGTLLTLVVLGVALGLFAVLNAQSYAGTLSAGLENAVYVFGTVLAVVPALVILWVAFTIGVRQSVGKQWLLIGLGALAFGLGDVTWTIIELVLGLDPYPSVADAFYLLNYVFFLAAVVIAIRSYRGFVDMKRPLLLGTAVAIAASGLVYVVLLRPFVFPGVDEIGMAGAVFSTIYPIADVALMFAPAVALAVVIGQLGWGRFAWPWWIVIAGALVFAVTDSFYSYADWAGIGTTAALDLGWIGAQMLLAVAALVARDVYSS